MLYVISNLHLIYINNPLNNSIPTVKQQIHCCTYCHSKTSAYKLKSNFKNKSEWTYQWKIFLNPNLNKRSQEVNYFTQKFASTIISGKIYLDGKWDFYYYNFVKKVQINARNRCHD